MSVDQAAAAEAVRALLRALGQDVSSESLADTPQRVAASFAELLAAPDFDLKTFPNEEGYDELVVARSIPFHSLCEHHLIPFVGTAHVAYMPGERIVGLSKLARVVDLYARRPQVQERLTSQVADAVMRRLEPRGVIVVVQAEHLCMAMRGIRKPGSRAVTSAVRGQLRNPATRAEAMSLILGR